VAGDHHNISFILVKTKKEEALKSLSNPLAILQEFERQTGYHHPLVNFGVRNLIIKQQLKE
jgi:hypothetical protein